MFKKLLPPKKERKMILVIAILSILFASITTYYLLLKGIQTNTLQTHEFLHTSKSFAGYTEYTTFFAIALFPLFYLLKNNILPKFKTYIRILAKIAHKFHVPIALIGIALVFIHAISAFMNGWKWNFHYLSGAAAFLVLLPIPVSGLLRYHRLDRRWHLRLGIIFFGLFLMHTYI